MGRDTKQSLGCLEEFPGRLGVVVPLVWHSGSQEVGESLEFQAMQAYMRPLFVCLFVCSETGFLSVAIAVLELHL